MDLAALALPADFRKLQYLRTSFAAVLRELNALRLTDPVSLRARREAQPILRAAAQACIFDGEPGPVIRKYYAFTGDFRNVWFSLDFLSIMPECLAKKRDREEAIFLFKNVLALLVNEVRLGLREDLGI